MTIDIVAIFTTMVALLLVASIVAVAKHISNSNKHPCKKDIVFKIVCDKTQDCIEGELKVMNEWKDKFEKSTGENFKIVFDKLDDINSYLRNKK